jgi:hypothetical protein
VQFYIHEYRTSHAPFLVLHTLGVGDGRYYRVMAIDYTRILSRFDDQPIDLKAENTYLRQLIETQKAENLRLKRILQTNLTAWAVPAR